MNWDGEQNTIKSALHNILGRKREEYPLPRGIGGYYGGEKTTSLSLSSCGWAKGNVEGKIREAFIGGEDIRTFTVPYATYMYYAVIFKVNYC